MAILISQSSTCLKSRPCMTLLKFYRHLQPQPLFSSVSIANQKRCQFFIQCDSEQCTRCASHFREDLSVVLMCTLFSAQLFPQRTSFWICPMKFAPCGQMLGFGSAYPSSPLIILLALLPLICPRRRPLKCWSNGANYRLLLPMWPSSNLL